VVDRANLSFPGTIGPQKRAYFKRNYVKALEIITPDVYLEEDYELSGVELNPFSRIINTHINLANNGLAIGLGISATDGYPDIDTFDGFSEFFVTQNNLTNVTPFSFNEKILKPLGVTWSTFDTSTSFQAWVSGVLIPKITISSPNLVETTEAAFASTTSGTHEYLIRNLSWFYFLTAAGNPELNYAPSSYVETALARDLYAGKTLTLNDGIKGATEYIWRNYSASAIFSSVDLLPAPFISSIESTSSTWTSGTQLLENLNTAIDILYSPAVMDTQDTEIADALYNYKSVGSYLSDTEAKGPFYKLLKILGFAISDYVEDSEKLSLLYDIQACPDEYLPLLAELIGWHLFGHDSSRHRLQLQNAVEVYKRQGTKVGVQFALDSVFASGVFDVKTKITELWESYIPNLILYTLVSESPLFVDLTTWTQEEAIDRGIASYSTSSIDENIRTVVDHILLALIKKHPDHFPLAGTTIKNLIEKEDLSFWYRGRVFSAPPFEEYKYYKDSKISVALLESLKEILINSFCIPEGIADGLNTYIKDNTINTINTVSTNFVDNQWLFFTSGVTYPNNEFVILDKLGNEANVKTLERREKYLSLWNGKSSHVSITVQADGFNFTKTALEGDSGQILIQAGKILKHYVPAHAIVAFMAEVSGTDYIYDNDDLVALWSQCFPQETFEAVSSVGLSRYGSVAADTRALYASPTFTRDAVDGVNCTNTLLSQRGLSDAMVSSTATTVKPRRALRRKNLVNFIEMCKHYSRTGYNMPLSFDASTQEYSMASSVGFIPLGYIASANKFQPAEVSSLHDVWSVCEDLNNDRNQVLPVVGLMHKLTEQLNYKTAEKAVLNASADFAPSSSWKNHILSYANSAVENLDWSPSANWFYNFAWGRGINSLYHDYITHMGSHVTTPEILSSEGGLDIISHAYGPLLFNSTFNADGSAVSSTVAPILSASSFHSSAISALNYGGGSGVLSFFGGSAYGTIEVTDIADLPVSAHVSGAAELRNPDIASGIELVVTSATPSDLNHFIVFKIDPVNAPQTVDKSLVNNRIIKMKAVDGFPRIRIDLNKYGLNSSNVEGNLLMPEHEFKFSTKFLISDETKPIIGGGSLGVFIHTAVETSDNVIWIWTPQENWVKVSAKSLTKDAIINKYSHIKHLPLETVDTSDIPLNICGEESYTSSLTMPQKFSVDTFKDFEFTFDTRNDRIIVDNQYFASGSGLCASTVTGRQVHRADQKYVIEIFMLPSLANESIATILESVSMIDLTEFDKTKIKLPFSYSTSLGSCSAQAEVGVERQDMLTVLDHFKSMATGSFSRNAVVTSSTMDTSGGSKINYREHPEWTEGHTTVSGLYTVVEATN